MRLRKTSAWLDVHLVTASVKGVQFKERDTAFPAKIIPRKEVATKSADAKGPAKN